MFEKNVTNVDKIDAAISVVVGRIAEITSLKSTNFRYNCPLPFHPFL